MRKETNREDKCAGNRKNKNTAKSWFTIFFGDKAWLTRFPVLRIGCQICKH